MFRFGRVGLSIALISTLTLGACADSEPAGPEGEDYEEAPVIEQAALPLVEGRTVEVQKWTNGIAAPVRQGFGTSKTAVDMLLEACRQSELIALGVVIPQSPTTAQQTCDAVPTFLDTHYYKFHSGTPTPAYHDQLTLLCAAHWSLQMAESASTTYVVYDSIFALVAKRRDKLEYPWSLLTGSLATTLTANLKDDQKIAYSFEPPSASDAASWSLLAVELYREAALAGQQILSNTSCVGGGLAYEASALAGGAVSLIDQVAANTVDAITSMNEAAGKAEKLVAAAAQAKRGQSGDPVEGLTQAWRGRYDSRLEGASVYAKISESKFERPQLVPLWEMIITDADTATTGNQPSYYYSTAPESAPVGHSRSKVVGWLYPPNGPRPPGTYPVITYRASATSPLYVTTDTTSASWLDTHVGAMATRVSVRTEGYDFVPDSGPDPRVSYMRQVKSSSGAARFRWIGPGETIPSGFALTSQVDWIYPFTSPESQVDLYAATQKLPVQTLLPGSKGERRAASLLRTTRVSPCQEAVGACSLVNTTGRNPQVIADDMLRVLKGDRGVGFSFSTAQALLQQAGISLDELDLAARRISQEATVLGRAFVDDPEWPAATDNPATAENEAMRPRRVYGSGQSPDTAHPAFLYAQTAGEVDFTGGEVPEYIWTTGSPSRGLAYARTSTIAALDYLRLKLDEIAAGLSAPNKAAPWGVMLQEASALAKQYVDEPMQLHVQRTGANITSLKLMRLNLPYATVADMQAGCDAWLGEAGLECALDGVVGGLKCDPTRYRFSKTSDASSATPWTVDTATKWSSFGLDASEAPTRPGGSSTAFKPGERVYVTCNLSGANQVVAGITATLPNAAGSWKAFIPPYSTALQEALTNLLAASPEAPEQSNLSCAGVPYNTKLALEDELTEAVTGQDSVESSFAYYLRLAREAADRADQLGNELIEQGIQMDLRAEVARDELENLCGGVVDVGKLEARACQTHNCDIVKLLTDTSVSNAGVLQAELAGVRACLGIGSSAPHWAAVGDTDLCVWQYVPTDSRTPVPPPCVCPPGASACAAMEARGCPAKPYGQEGCRATYGGIEQTSPPWSPGWSTGQAGKVVTWRITKPDLLGLSVSDKDGQGEQDETPYWWRSCDFFLNGHLRSTGGSGYATTKLPAWVNPHELLPLAETIGFKEDVYGFPTLTIGGNDWIRVGGANDGPSVVDVNAGWPCATHPDLVSRKAGADLLATQVPAATLPLMQLYTGAALTCDKFPSGNGSRPLLCGGHCGTAGQSAAERTALQTGYLRDRLMRAVLTLKGITGASWENVKLARRVVLPSFFQTLLDQRLSPASAVPSWHYLSGRTRFMSDDSNLGCWNAAPGSVECRQVYSAARPSPRGTPNGWNTQTFTSGAYFNSGFSDNVAYLWSQSWDLSGEARVQTAGSLAKYLRYLAGGKVPPPEALSLDYNIDGTIIDPDSGCNLSPDEWCVWDGARADVVCGDDLVGWDRRVPTSTMRGMGRQFPGYTNFSVSDPMHYSVSEPISMATHDAIMNSNLYGLDAACDQDATGSSYRGRDVLDALSIACEARERTAGGCTTLMAQLPNVNTVEDFPRLARRLQCSADTVETSIEKMYVAGLPADVIQALADGAVTQTFPTNRGAFGTTLASLAAKISSLRLHTASIASALRDIGADISRANIVMRKLGLDGEITDVQRYIDAELASMQVEAQSRIDQAKSRQAMSAYATKCAKAVSSAVGNWVKTASGAAAGDMVAATAECVDTGIQIGEQTNIDNATEDLKAISFEKIEAIERLMALRQRVTEEDKKLALLELQTAVASRGDRINEAMLALITTQAEIHGLLAQLDSQRSQARRAGAKVLMLDNDDVGRQYSVNTAMRARMNTLRARYEAAREKAIRLAYLARRAVEQKLGVDMSLMSDDMTLVPAPDTWVDKLCSLPGINYAEIRRGGKQVTVSQNGSTTTTTVSDTDSTADRPRDYNYADGYVGDWVGKLEQFVESYRLDFPFQDAADVAVVSLRDEIVNSRQTCEVDGWNDLYFSRSTMTEVSSASSELGWEYTCEPVTGSAVAARGTPVSESPLRCLDSTLSRCNSLGGVQATRLERATTAACQPSPLGLPPPAGAARVRQEVAPTRGTQVLSWYQKANEARLSVVIERNASRETLTPTGSISDTVWPAGTTGLPAGARTDPWQAPGWNRYFLRVESGVTHIGFVAPAQPTVLAAMQFEQDGLGLGAPDAFFPTEGSLSQRSGQCEDYDGSEFRNGWTRACEYYCPPGTGTDCAANGFTNGLPKRCFYEKSFALSVEDIEKGKQIQQGGFARGNFNYRFDELAVNMVGTAIKDCERSSQPTACYAANFLQYSVRHSEPFRVRNYDGDEVHAPLFVGNIQQAKGLLAERYLTNPLSGADRGLLTDYWRGEFKGRPIDGNFTLRIYETDGLYWEALQDVQLVIKYKYWTRFQDE